MCLLNAHIKYEREMYGTGLQYHFRDSAQVFAGPFYGVVKSDHSILTRCEPRQLIPFAPHEAPLVIYYRRYQTNYSHTGLLLTNYGRIIEIAGLPGEIAATGLMTAARCGAVRLSALFALAEDTIVQDLRWDSKAMAAFVVRVELLP